MEKCFTSSYSSKAVFSTLPMHEDETARRGDGGCSHSPSFLGSIASSPLLMMLCCHIGILLWFPGNPEITEKRYGCGNGLHGRWSPSKWPSVIKTIHSLLCVNMKQKHIFCLISETSYLTSWDLMCMQAVGNLWRRMNLCCLCSCLG